MVLSRFWYLVLALALGASAYLLFVATAVHNREALRAAREGLQPDVQVVASYLRDDARRRSSLLIAPSLDEEIRSQVAKSSAAADKVPAEARDKARSALRKQGEAMPADGRFDALFAVDAAGRVVAQTGFDQAAGLEGFELGGYPLVADALHGWVRDDAWVLGGRIYRVVARPIELEAGALPAGAIVGARIVDDTFARELSRRTSAAVGFYAAGKRVASGAPESFDTGQLDFITNDLAAVERDPAYKDKGLTDVRVLHGDLAVIYARLPGEAWDLGAGFAVARLAHLSGSPLEFESQKTEADKAAVPMGPLGAVAAALALIGLLFSVLEHTRPLHAFRSEVLRLAKGEIEQLTASRFRGVYRKIASDLNDGIEKVAAKGGGARRADLEQVLGPIPTQPAMSAFAFPGAADASSDVAATSATTPSAPRPLPVAPPPPPMRALEPTPIASSISSSAPPPPRPVPPRPPGRAEEADVEPSTQPLPEEMAEWLGVFDEFVRVKQQCSEPTEGLTFEKFQVTLRKNRDALVQKHACRRVKFTVYVKEGRAALKASPVRE